MPEKTVDSSQTRLLQVLDEDGNADSSLLPEISEDGLKKIYELMVLARTFDQRALSLQREGRLGTYASILGQEAAQAASAFALERRDWVFPSFRESGVYITLGYPMHLMYLFWAGDERGNHAPEGLNIFPVCVPVGTHLPHAVGAALAARYKKHDIVVAAYFGDGATSKGDFHEALNMAGVFNLPVVFICQNNQWAISVPRERQTASATLAQKAHAYGFEGVQVDGNDVFAVYRAANRAVRKAREGSGPTLIECFTYRMGHHTTADDSTRYRTQNELEAWAARDPISRLKKYMQKKVLFTDQYEKEVYGNSEKEVAGAVKAALAMPPASPGEMFEFTYGKMPERLARQMREPGYA